MKVLLGGVGLLVLATICGVIFLWPTQRSGPEPIVFGRDACAHCRMHISQPGFGGEVRDRNGVLTKYDDVGCMLQAMVAMHREIPEAWVEDHDGGGFVPLLTAQLVRTEDGGTPMGYGIVAFADATVATTYAQAHGGQAVSLEDVMKAPGRLAQRSRTSAEERGNP
jgi:NosL protein